MTDNINGAPSPTEQTRINEGPQTINLSETARQYEGIFKGATEKGGLPARELTADTLISIPMPSGQTMSGVPLRAAERMGYVERDEHGNYREKVQTAEAPTQDPAKEQVPLPDAKAEQLLGDLFQACQNAGVDPVAMVSPGALNQADKNSAISKIAAHSGNPIGAVKASFDVVLKSAATQIVTTVQGEGVDPVAFMQWASTHENHLLNGAHLRHLHGNLEGYRQLAQKYRVIKGMGPSREPIAGQGQVTVLSHGKTNTGQPFVEVRLPNGKTAQVSESNARRQGWVR